MGVVRPASRVCPEQKVETAPSNQGQRLRGTVPKEVLRCLSKGRGADPRLAKLGAHHRLPLGQA